MLFFAARNIHGSLPSVVGFKFFKPERRFQAKAQSTPTSLEHKNYVSNWRLKVKKNKKFGSQKSQLFVINLTYLNLFHQSCSKN